MTQTPVRLHTWLRLQREDVPLAARADALCRALRGCPEVRQAYYLSWQPGARIYSHEGSGQQLPPGQGDPLEASDERLAARLAEEGRLSLQELRRLDGWLAGRLRRAAISHGQAFDLALAADQRGLLLVEVHEGVTLDWLGWVHELLAALLGSVNGLQRASPLLGHDPQPSLLVDAGAAPRELNAALLAVLPLIFGLPGIPLAALGGVLCTALLLMRRQALLGALPWARLWLLSALAMALAAGLLFRIDGIWLQLGLGTVAGCLALLGMALWLRPWRTD